MLRVLLVLAAVLVAVLAFVFDRPWLYAVAAVPLVGALGLLVRSFWAASQVSSSRAAAVDPPDDSLEDLGIMDVRPQEREGGTNGTSASEEPSEEPPPETSSAGAQDPEGDISSQEEWLDEYRDELEASQAATECGGRSCAV